jgi:hypothetical protein
VIGDAKWRGQRDRVVRRTAARLSAVIDKMRHDLPEGAAPTTALELALEELASLQPLIALVDDLRRGPPAARPREVDPTSITAGSNDEQGRCASLTHLPAPPPQLIIT